MKLFRRRSSTTGRFVTEATAEQDPAGTIAERIQPPHVNAYARALCESLAEQGDVEHLSDPSLAAYQVLLAELG